MKAWRILQGDLDNTLLRTVAWQQTILIVLQSGMMSGNKRDLERTQGPSLASPTPLIETDSLRPQPSQACRSRSLAVKAG